MVPRITPMSYWLRTGRVIPADVLERKFNPNHDPNNGQFASGAGASAGPFRNHAKKKGVAGDTARALNNLVTDSHARVTLSLGGQNLRVARTGANTVELSMLGGGVKANGIFLVVSGKQQINLTLGSPHESFFARTVVSIQSFPNKISIFESSAGQLRYTINTAIVVTSALGNVNQKAGNYLIGG